MDRDLALLDERVLCAAAVDGTEEAALANAIEAVDPSGAVKKDFLVLPFGDPIPTRDGRGPYILRDRAHAERVLAASRDFLGSGDMMADYDHQSEYASNGVGNQAPASGWIKSDQLRVDDAGIHVVVDWTPEGEQALASRRYRYVSPNFRVSRATREVTRLVNIGLTNSPNLDLPALAHQAGAQSGEYPDMRKIQLLASAAAAALGLPVDDLDETKVLAAIDGLKDKAAGAETALASVRSELKLAGDADTEAVIASIQSAAKAGAPDPTKYVPKAGYDEVNARLATLEEDRVIAMVDGSKKIPPAMRQWAIDLGKKDEPALNAYLAAAPTFGGDTPIVNGNPQPEKGKLSEEEKAICAATGVPEEVFLKTRDEEKV